MTDDILKLDDQFYPIPPSAVDADPAETIEKLLFRVARLEASLEGEEVPEADGMREVLLDLIAISDQVTAAVERWGVATNAKEAAVARTLVDVAKALLSILKRQRVEAMETIGRLHDPSVSDIVGREERPQLAEGTVLREKQIGYRWPGGILRRAQVVVSTRPEEKGSESEEEQDVRPNAESEGP